ncbi:AMP-binding protein [Microscilla marina]|uniref:AMP-dependent synthetase and ligase n=1 Tax=Microscilla marina ATCC 23134 TaxID=313606 RepID=A1ZL30_MICM2|nr:AMP-binding protein [Microscilla marina]EAY28996.1 AMP-dependent synthetase and ligase [Microscilla marina ATCC 23134]
MDKQSTTLENSNASTSNQQDIKLLIEYFYDWEQKRPNEVYLRQPKGDTWKEYTWAEVGNQVRRMATAIQALNLPERSNIGIVSKNCAHWIMNDLAIIMSGHVSVPFYPTLQAEQLNQVMTHSECKILFVGKLDDWEGMKAGVPEGVHCIAYPNSPSEADGFDKWDDLTAKHEPLQGNPVADPDELATIIYTSGTTGMPKGVMHSYRTAIAPMSGATPILKVGATSDRYFSYLPLCHIAERAIVETASLYSGGTVSFVESLDTFAKNLQDVAPTHFLAVPRIWTKFQLGILEKMSQGKLNVLLNIPIISSIVKKKIRTALGLNNTKLLLTGAAPMPPTLIAWYQKLGMNIREAYGMTENGGCCTVMPADENKLGTIGKPYPSCDMKIEEGTGEICMRAPWVMTGYYKEPDITKKVLKEGGWLHTGDQGEFDKDGFLKITGRVKDTFKSAKGEYIVPAPIEAQFAINNHIEQVCVLGRNLPQPVMLVVLSEIGLQAPKAEVTESIAETLTEVNATLINYERLNKLVVVSEPWSVENGILTPTLKIKRNILEAHYQDQLLKWYELKEKVVWE